MRVYFTTTVARTEAIFRDGFTDLDSFGDLSGVWFADRPLDANDGFEGDVTLCLDIADNLFGQYECVEEGGLASYRSALIPAEVLNRLGKPQVYDHFYAGLSRRDLVRGAQRWDGGGLTGKAQELRDAIEFFDRIGWLTPLKLRESEGNRP